MSAPVVLSSTPNPNDTDIVLGSPIKIVFDQAIDPTSVDSATFVLTGPGTTQFVDSEQLQQGNSILSGREYVSGDFSYPNASTLVFTPKTPLRPGLTYTVLVVGGNSVLISKSVTNPAGEKLAANYQFTFTTGTLNLRTPPVTAPLTWETTQQYWDRPKLNVSSIRVNPRKSEGADLTQTIELIFPGPVDPNSFNPEELMIAVEPFLNDPLVPVPTGLSSTVQVVGNKILITISGWS